MFNWIWISSELCSFCFSLHRSQRPCLSFPSELRQKNVVRRKEAANEQRKSWRRKTKFSCRTIPNISQSFAASSSHFPTPPASPTARNIFYYVYRNDKEIIIFYHKRLPAIEIKLFSEPSPCLPASWNISFPWHKSFCPELKFACLHDAQLSHVRQSFDAAKRACLPKLKLVSVLWHVRDGPLLLYLKIGEKRRKIEKINSVNGVVTVPRLELKEYFLCSSIIIRQAVTENVGVEGRRAFN